MSVLDADTVSFVHARPRLFGIARRVLGSASDADDIVQEAWIRWQESDRSRRARPGGVPGHDHDAARAQRRPVGPRAARDRLRRARSSKLVDPGADPVRGAEQRDALARALWTVLETLSPTERAVYVLREAFDYPHRRIAEALGLSEANARQLVTRARRHIAGEPRWTVDTGRARARWSTRSSPPRTAATSSGSRPMLVEECDVTDARIAGVADLFAGFAQRELRDDARARSTRSVGGSGPPLLLLHGYPESLLMWHASAPLLARAPHRRRRPTWPATGRRSGPAPTSATRRTASARSRSTRWRRWRGSGSTPSPWPVTTAAARVAYRMALDHPETRAAARGARHRPDRRGLGESERRRRARLLALGVPGAACSAAGAADRRRPGGVLRLPRARAARAGGALGPLPARRARRLPARSTTPALSRPCARTTGRARPSTSSTTTPTAPPAAGSRAPCSCCGRPAAACRASTPTCSTSGARGRATCAATGDRRHALPGRGRPGRPSPATHLPVMSAIARDHCLAPERVDAPIYGGRYRSLFEDLPPLRVDEGALHALGRPGGPCDLGDGAAEDTDAEVAAVWPFFGQFIAHDITADRSPLVAPRRPGADPQLPRPAGEPRGRLRQPGRSARRTCTPPTIPRSCCSRHRASTCRATTRGSR